MSHFFLENKEEEQHPSAPTRFDQFRQSPSTWSLDAKAHNLAVSPIATALDHFIIAQKSKRI
jgi:hypothetical protein